MGCYPKKTELSDLIALLIVTLFVTRTDPWIHSWGKGGSVGKETESKTYCQESVYLDNKDSIA